jgi:hypothetical protein
VPWKSLQIIVLSGPSFPCLNFLPILRAVVDDFTLVSTGGDVVVGAFPDGHSALMLCATRLRHITGTKWGQKCYMNTDLFKKQELEQTLEAGEAI